MRELSIRWMFYRDLYQRSKVYSWCNRYEDETSLSSTTLKFRDNEESCAERSVIPNKLHADEPPATVSAIMAIGQPEVKYAQPVK